MKLIIGLGNPDKKYENTRHNLGQKIVIDFLKKQNLELKKIPKLSAQLSELPCRDARSGVSTKFNNKILIGITTEYMNNSGLSVQKITKFYKISPQDIYIIHDDLDLPVGDFKIQFDRGPAGHNGIKSIIENLNTQQFNRIRVGISKASDNIPVEDYVLLPFTSEEKIIIDSLIPKIFTEISKITEI